MNNKLSKQKIIDIIKDMKRKANIASNKRILNQEDYHKLVIFIYNKNNLSDDLLIRTVQKMFFNFAEETRTLSINKFIELNKDNLKYNINISKLSCNKLIDFIIQYLSKNNIQEKNQLAQLRRYRSLIPFNDIKKRLSIGVLYEGYTELHQILSREKVLDKVKNIKTNYQKMKYLCYPYYIDIAATNLDENNYKYYDVFIRLMHKSSVSKEKLIGTVNKDEVDSYIYQGNPINDLDISKEYELLHQYASLANDLPITAINE